MLATPVSDGSASDAGQYRRAHQRIVLAVDMGPQGALAVDIGNLPVDGHLPADDVVGDIEELQGGAEIVGLEQTDGGRRPAEAQRNRAPVGVAALDLACDCQIPPVRSSSAVTLAKLALRAKHQPIDPGIERERRRRRRWRTASSHP